MKSTSLILSLQVPPVRPMMPQVAAAARAALPQRLIDHAIARTDTDRLSYDPRPASLAPLRWTDGTP